MVLVMLSPIKAVIIIEQEIQVIQDILHYQVQLMHHGLL